MIDRDDGQSDLRTRTAVRTALSTGIGTVASIVTNLLLVPIVLSATDAEQFGAWATLVATLALLTPLDLGVSNAAMTHLARSAAHGDVTSVRATVRIAFLALVGFGAAIALIGVALVYVARVPVPLGLADTLGEESARRAALALVVALAIALPVGLVEKANLGLQRGYRNGQLFAVSALATFTCTAIAAQTTSSPTALFLAGAVGQLGARALALLTLLREHGGHLPSWVASDVSAALLRSAPLFVVLELTSVVAFSADQVVIAEVLGAEAVGEFHVPYRLFVVLTTAVTVALRPLWPAYADAIQRRDTVWVRRTLRRSLLVVVGLALVAGAVLVAAGPVIVRVWTSDEIGVSRPLLVWFAAWGIVFAASSCVGTLLNAALVRGFQIAVASSMAIVNLVTSVLLVRRFGIGGVLAGSVVSYCAIVLAPYVWFVLRRLDDVVDDSARATASRSPLAPSATASTS